MFYIKGPSPVPIRLFFFNIVQTGGGEGDSEEKLFRRGPVRKYAPNACFWELLMQSGVF